MASKEQKKQKEAKKRNKGLIDNFDEELDFNNISKLVGYLYREGLGTEKNYKEALKWFKKSAEQGNFTAMENLEYLKSLM